MTVGFERFPFEPMKPTFSRWTAVAVAVVAAIMGTLQSLRALGEGDTLKAVLTATIFGVFTLIGLGIVPLSKPRGSFRYINATVMTKAEKPTADSWVHLAPARGVRLSLILAGAVTTVASWAVIVFIVLVLLGYAERVNPEDTTEGGYLLALVPFLGFSALATWITSLQIARRIRNSGFGERPAGLALGETTVTIRVPGQEVEIPWDQIVSVQPKRIASLSETGGSVLLNRRGRGDHLDLIRMTLQPGGDITVSEQWCSADGYTVPKDALYTALRFYHAHPEHRWELGRVEGERRLEGWHRRALDSEPAKQIR